MRMLSPWWRTQDRTVAAQLADGVRYFDIRMRYDRGGGIRYCHGIVDFAEGEAREAVRLILAHPAARYRIVLERGSAADEARFRDMIRDRRSSGGLPGLDMAVIKGGWKIVCIPEGCVPSTCDMTRPGLRSDRPWWRQPLGLLRSLLPIRRWAMRHNPAAMLPPGAATSGQTAYFLDYYEYALRR